MCFYDLQKAFGSVQYPVLLKHSYEAAIDGKTWRLIRECMVSDEMRWFGGLVVTDRAWLLNEAGSGESVIQSLLCLVRHDPEPCLTV